MTIAPHRLVGMAPQLFDEAAADEAPEATPPAESEADAPGEFKVSAADHVLAAI